MKTILKSILFLTLLVSVPVFLISCGEEDEPDPVTVSANAGTDQTVNLGEVVTLDGSGSSSSDGSALVYLWAITTQPTGSTATIGSPTSESPSFTPDEVGDYVLTLTVTSGTAVDTDQVTITAQSTGPNEDPMVAFNEGDSVKFRVGADFTLELTVSDADGDDLDITLEVLEQDPAGTNPSLSPDLVNPPAFIFNASDPGYYKLRVEADDNKGGTDADTIQLFIGNVLASSVTSDLTMEDYFTEDDCPDWYLITNSTIQADVTVEPGVLMISSEDVGISVETSGSLNAIGAMDNMIRFTAEEDSKGYWRGLEFLSNTTSNELTYFEISYGGSSGFDGADLQANVMVDDAGRLKITNSRIANSGGYGLYVRDLESTLVDFADNEITANSAPVNALLNHYHYFDSESDYTGNDDDYIDSEWKGNDTSLDVTWKALNVPYRLADNIDNIESDITIEAGAVFLGQPQSGLEISGSGSLNAVGTANEKIVFKGEQTTSGYWLGLNFQTNNTSNELTFVEISDGGADGFDGANLLSNIMVENAGRLKITNTSSSNSAGYGLYTRDKESILVDFADNTLTENLAPVMTRISHYSYFDDGSDYSGNTNDYIDSYWSNNDGTTGTVTWNALNVPYRIADNIEDIDLNITIAAGAEFIGQPESGLEISTTGSLRAEGTSGNRIVFRGEQDVAGYWKGIQILSNTTENVFDYISISNGGSEGFDGANRKANIEVWDSGRLEVSNSLINKSGDAGIREEASATFVNGGGNSFSGNVVDLDLDV